MSLNAIFFIYFLSSGFIDMVLEISYVLVFCLAWWNTSRVDSTQFGQGIFNKTIQCFKGLLLTQLDTPISKFILQPQLVFQFILLLHYYIIHCWMYFGKNILLPYYVIMMYWKVICNLLEIYIQHQDGSSFLLIFYYILYWGIVYMKCIVYKLLSIWSFHL